MVYEETGGLKQDICISSNRKNKRFYKYCRQSLHHTREKEKTKDIIGGEKVIITTFSWFKQVQKRLTKLTLMWADKSHEYLFSRDTRTAHASTSTSLNVYKFRCSDEFCGRCWWNVSRRGRHIYGYWRGIALTKKQFSLLFLFFFFL